ncbi:unnamed protein product [Rotaria sp. Silwood2]|nr:unnamed protein product [Rotaria sp. Silwood2]
MANYTSTALENKLDPTKPDMSYKLEQLFRAVESSNVNTISNFDKDELRVLYEVRRSFNSAWSSPENEQQSAYQRACLLGRTDIVQCMLKANVPANQSLPGGTSMWTMRGAFMFACESDSMPTTRVLIATHVPVDTLSSCSLNYANFFIPGINRISPHSRSKKVIVIVFNNNNLLIPI